MEKRYNCFSIADRVFRSRNRASGCLAELCNTGSYWRVQNLIDRGWKVPESNRLAWRTYRILIPQTPDGRRALHLCYGGFINGVAQVDVVLDTTALTPLVCHGPIGPLSVSSLRLKEEVEFATLGICDGTEEKSGIFIAMRFASSSMITLERPTVVINPSVLKGTVIHFDGTNSRVGFKPLDL